MQKLILCRLPQNEQVYHAHCIQRVTVSFLLNFCLIQLTFLDLQPGPSPSESLLKITAVLTILAINSPVGLYQSLAILIIFSCPLTILALKILATVATLALGLLMVRTQLDRCMVSLRAELCKTLVNNIYYARTSKNKTCFFSSLDNLRFTSIWIVGARWR